jgi:hypothetical protein
MKKLLILLVFPLFSSSSLFSDDNFEESINIRMQQVGELTENLLVGVHPDATYGLDTALGEKDYPGYSFEGLEGLFTFYDDSNGTVMSKYDVRPVPADDIKFKVTYTLKVNPGYKSDFYFKWDDLSEYIDSAHIVDWYEANLFFADMKASNEALVPADLLKDNANKFDIIVWYTKIPVSVETNTDLNCYSDIELYPMPCDDNLNVKGIESTGSYKIYDYKGTELLKGEINMNNAIKTDKLQSGVYYICVYLSNGEVIRKLFVRN